MIPSSPAIEGDRATPPTVEKRAGVSYLDFVNQYERPNRPVVLTDALKGWRALERWSPEFFKANYGDKEFVIDEKRYRLGELMDTVLASSRENPAPYLRNQVLREHFPDLLDDIDPNPPFVRPNWMRRLVPSRAVRQLLQRGAEIELYIGGSGRGFPVLHWDGLHTHAFLLQISGRKQFFVYGPDQTPYLYPQPHCDNVSQVNDVENPDLDKFPLFAKTAPAVFVLEPGEMLFIPSGWWHTTRMLTPSISISFNVANASNWKALTHDLAMREGRFVGRWRRWSLNAAGLFFSLCDSLAGVPM